MYITLWIKVSANVYAVVDFIGFARMNLVMSQVVTERCFKSSNPFGMNFMSMNKPFTGEQSNGIVVYFI